VSFPLFAPLLFRLAVWGIDLPYSRLVHSLPEQVHWLCDKIEKRDDGVEVRYEGDKSRRNRSVTHAMVLLSFADQEETQAWFTAALNVQLSRCPRCVEQFYVLKKGLYKELLE